MTTKRRKVWVAFYGDDEHRSFSSQKRAKSDASDVAPFVEARPGDVVLSREDVARAQQLLDEVACAYADGDDKRKLRALLRGGR